MEFLRNGCRVLAPGDLIWPPPAVFRSPDSFRAWERDHGTQGGAFATLLGNYLKDESNPAKKLYLEPGPSAPPLLNGKAGALRPVGCSSSRWTHPKRRERPCCACRNST